MNATGTETNGAALRVLVAALCLIAAVTLTPLWVPLLLAAWCAIVVRPLHRALAKRIHRSKGAATLLTVLLVIGLLTPLVIASLSLAGSATELVRRLVTAGSASEALRELAAGGERPKSDLQGFDWRHVAELGRRHAASAMTVGRTLFDAATMIVVAGVVFVAGFYTFLFEGARLHEWLLSHSPLPRWQAQRLSSVFAEVGRGLLVGIGLAALLQGAIATIGYVACDVPQPLVLGLLTVLASLIPSVGSGLVWAPVTAALALTGRPGAAVAMLMVGCFVAVVDNLMRPIFAKYGRLHMHGLLLFAAMLGGIMVFGARGLLLGPLVVRLAIEGLVMLRESSAHSAPSSQRDAPS